MNKEEKKAFMLLLSVIFHYHGLDREERELLEKRALKLEALDEMEWANEFIAEDYLTAFERARDYLAEAFKNIDKKTRLQFLKEVWKANLNKGFITEMEARAMIRLAKDWDIDNELLRSVRKMT